MVGRWAACQAGYLLRVNAEPKEIIKWLIKIVSPYHIP
jgi:hypothetical protein